MQSRDDVSRPAPAEPAPHRWRVMDSRRTPTGEPTLIATIEEHHLFYEITRVEAPEKKVAFDTLDEALQWILRPPV